MAVNDLRMAAVDAILNTPIPTRDERRVARLRTLGLVLPTTTTLVRTDLPPHLILIDYPNGLLGSEPRREREHAWWESSLDLRELVRVTEYADPDEFVLTRLRMEQAFRLLQPLWSEPTARHPFVITGACT